MFVDVNSDNSIDVRNGLDKGVAIVGPVVDSLKNIVIGTRPTPDEKGIVLECGQQEIQIDAENGRIKDVYVRQVRTEK